MFASSFKVRFQKKNNGSFLKNRFSFLEPQELLKEKKWQTTLSSCLLLNNKYIFVFFGDVVQLVERLLCTQEVIGSSPFISNKIFRVPQEQKEKLLFTIRKRLSPRACVFQREAAVFWKTQTKKSCSWRMVLLVSKEEANNTWCLPSERKDKTRGVVTCRFGVRFWNTEEPQEPPCCSSCFLKNPKNRSFGTNHSSGAVPNLLLRSVVLLVSSFEEEQEEPFFKNRFFLLFCCSVVLLFRDERRCLESFFVRREEPKEPALLWILQKEEQEQVFALLEEPLKKSGSSALSENNRTTERFWNTLCFKKKKKQREFSLKALFLFHKKQHSRPEEPKETTERLFKAAKDTTERETHGFLRHRESFLGFFCVSEEEEQQSKKKKQRTTPLLLSSLLWTTPLLWTAPLFCSSEQHLAALIRYKKKVGTVTDWLARRSTL